MKRELLREPDRVLIDRGPDAVAPGRDTAKDRAGKDRAGRERDGAEILEPSLDLR